MALILFGVALISATASQQGTKAFNEKAAKQPERLPDTRSNFTRSKRTGLYRAFILVGLLLVGTTVFWQMLLTNNVVEPSPDAFHWSAVAAPVPELASPSREQPTTSPFAQEQGPLQTLGQLPIAGIESAAAPLTSSGGLAPRSILRDVNITFYDCANQGFCGAMYNGKKVYEGVAACSWNLPLGTRFAIVGDPTHRIYVCEDRGILPDTWVDIFWYFPNQGYSWQGIVGRQGIIEIVSIP